MKLKVSMEWVALFTATTEERKTVQNIGADDIECVVADVIPTENNIGIVLRTFDFKETVVPADSSIYVRSRAGGSVVVLSNFNGGGGTGSGGTGGDLILGETSTTAFRGDRGKIAYNHSQLTDGNPHNTTKSDIGLGNVENLTPLDMPISTATQSALDLKANLTDLDGIVSGVSKFNGRDGEVVPLAGDYDKDMIGLGNVENIAPLDLPVSTLTQIELDKKLDTADALILGTTSGTALDGLVGTNHINSVDNPHNVDKVQVGLGNVENIAPLDMPISNSMQTALDLKVDTALIGVPSGIAPLESTGLISSTYLPAYVSNVATFPTFADFPVIGNDDTIYVAEDTNITYRWGGSQYVEISVSLALGETSQTAYQGDLGALVTNNFNAHAINYSNPHQVDKIQVGLGNVENLAPLDLPISTATQTELDLLNGRVDFVELENTEQNTRLDSVELENTAQNDRLDTIEALDIGTRLTNAELKNDEQDERLDVLEASGVGGTLGKGHVSRVINNQSSFPISTTPTLPFTDIVAPATGWYKITVRLNVRPPAGTGQTDILYLSQLVNGLDVQGSNKYFDLSRNGLLNSVEFSWDSYLNAGDTTTCHVWCGAVAGYKLETNASQSELGAEMVMHSLPNYQTDKPFMLQLNRVTNRTIPNGDILELIPLFNLAIDVQKVANISTTDFEIVTNSLKLPNLNRYVGYNITYTLLGTISGGAGVAREFKVELRRFDNSLVRNSPVIKIVDNQLEGRGTAINTYTFDSTDPFITGGLKLVLNNTSGQSITLTGVNMLIQGN